MLERHRAYSDTTEHRYTDHQYTDEVPWVSFIINIFQGLGMTHVWGNQFTLSAGRLKHAVVSELLDRFNQF